MGLGEMRRPQGNVKGKAKSGNGVRTDRTSPGSFSHARIKIIYNKNNNNGSKMNAKASQRAERGNTRTFTRSAKREPKRFAGARSDTKPCKE